MGQFLFYDFLKPENKGKKVYVCHGSACMTAYTQDQLYKTATTFRSERNRRKCCLGRCHENSAFHCGGKIIRSDDVLQIEE
ncbi:MAG: hypothetical protein IPP29_25140 [Bacteroidetes bacterium]|nr:hypothetical protein [Bacteroidota bacterium]